MKTLKEIVENIKNEENSKNEYNYYGIRYHYNKDVKIGDYTNNSNIWIDGDATDDFLNGVCTLDIREMVENDYSVEEIFEAANEYSYEGGEVIVLAGNQAENGNDEMELIINNAVRVA